MILPKEKRTLMQVRKGYTLFSVGKFYNGGDTVSLNDYEIRTQKQMIESIKEKKLNAPPMNRAIINTPSNPVLTEVVNKDAGNPRLLEDKKKVLNISKEEKKKMNAVIKAEEEKRKKKKADAKKEKRKRGSGKK